MDARRTDDVINVAVLAVSGELDIATAGAVQRDATRLLEGNGPDLVIDMSGVTFMDSSGLAALVAVRHTCTANGGELVLIGLDDKLRRLFHLTGLDFMLTGLRHHSRSVGSNDGTEPATGPPAEVALRADRPSACSPPPSGRHTSDGDGGEGTSMRYEITVGNNLSPMVQADHRGAGCRRRFAGSCSAQGPDQATLIRVLHRIGDFGLELLEVRHLPD